MGTTGGGLWKTDDMGISWRNVSDGFFKTGSVGAVAVAESDPNVVYVGMGEHAVRGVMTSSGDGVYKSTDAGKTWKKIGLDETRHISRIVIDPKNPNIVLVAAQGALYAPNKERGIFKSSDGGKKWSRITNDHRLLQRAWYYIKLFIDPKNDDTVYVMSAPALRSTDGGKTWENISGTHGDFHDLWINPDNAQNMIISNDGGSAISFNGGKTWSSQYSQPTC